MVRRVGHELGRALLLADAVSPDAMAQALLASVRDRVSLVRALLETGGIAMVRLEEELARTAPEAPLLRHPVPLLDLVERLPPHLCSALVAVPVRADALTGTVDVALADANDTHAAEEIAFYLSAPVRVVRSPLGAIESALEQARQARKSSTPPRSGPISVPPPSPVRPMSHTPPWGSPVLTGAEEHPALVSERPMPLIPKTASERVGEGLGERTLWMDHRGGERTGGHTLPMRGIADGDAAKGQAEAETTLKLNARQNELPMITEEIPILLQRRVSPGAGLVALARAAQELEEEEDAVMELRRTKGSSNPPQVVPAPVAPLSVPLAAHTALSLEPVAPNGDPNVTLTGEHRTITQPSTPLNQILREMTKVTARDPLMELVLIAIRPTAHKSALFAVKKDAYVGLMCTSDFGDRAQLVQVHIDARRPSFLSTTAAAGTYMGPMPRNDVHAPLTKFIKSREPEILTGATIRYAARGARSILHPRTRGRRAAESDGRPHRSRSDRGGDPREDPAREALTRRERSPPPAFASRLDLRHERVRAPPARERARERLRRANHGLGRPLRRHLRAASACGRDGAITPPSVERPEVRPAP